MKKGLGSGTAMLAWQYRTILAELQQVQLHMSDPTCPCTLGELNEWCIPKHLLSVASLAQETAAMDQANYNLFDSLGQEAIERHDKTRAILCQGADGVELLDWSRSWRKQIEPIYYACGTPQAGQDWQHPDNTVLGTIERQIVPLMQPRRTRRAAYDLPRITPPILRSVDEDPPGIIPPEYKFLQVGTRLVRDPAWSLDNAPDRVSLWAEALRRTDRASDLEPALVAEARNFWRDMGARSAGGLAGGFGVAIGSMLAGKLMRKALDRVPPEPTPFEEYTTGVEGGAFGRGRRYNRGDIDDTMRVAIQIARDNNAYRYVFATHGGYLISDTPPPFSQAHYQIDPAGGVKIKERTTNEEITIGQVHEDGATPRPPGIADG